MHMNDSILGGYHVDWDNLKIGAGPRSRKLKFKGRGTKRGGGEEKNGGSCWPVEGRGPPRELAAPARPRARGLERQTPRKFWNRE